MRKKYKLLIIIEIGLLLILALSYTAHLFLFNTLFFSIITGVFRWTLILLAIFYTVFGVAIFNQISSNALFMAKTYTGLSRKQVIAGVLCGVLMGLYFFAYRFHFELLFISVTLLIQLFFVIIVVSWMIKRSVLKQRILFRLLIPVTVFLTFKLMPRYFVADITYRKYPEYLKALKTHEANIENTALYNRYIQEEMKMRNDKGK